MNDFDSIIGDAVGHRADNAPLERPDFGDVLGARQQRLRRRSVIGAIGVLAIGATGMAAFAVGGPADSTADGPDTPIGSDGLFPSTIPGETLVAPETVWYCEGALDQHIAGVDQIVIATTTTAAPPTTIAAAVLDSSPVPDSGPLPEAAYVPPSEDFGFFRNCVLIESGAVAPADGDVPFTTSTEQFPTTTTSIFQVGPADTGPATTVGPNLDAPAATGSFESQPYVVRTGDYAIKVADQFCVPLEDLLDFNGWTTGSEFPFPGEGIAIPPGGCVETPSVPCTIPGCATAGALHTVQPGEYLIKIANDYCVAIADVMALNGWDTNNEFPFPGEHILIPAPPTEGVCADNGSS